MVSQPSVGFVSSKTEGAPALRQVQQKSTRNPAMPRSHLRPAGGVMLCPEITARWIYVTPHFVTYTTPTSSMHNHDRCVSCGIVNAHSMPPFGQGRLSPVEQPECIHWG